MKNLKLNLVFTILFPFLILGLSVILTSCQAPRAGFQPLEDEEKIVDLSAFFADGQDIILNSYHDPMLKEGVLFFFKNLTGSHEVAEAVLANASIYKIAPAMAFALCFEESRYNPKAFNRNKNETVDRGLFQLNSASFPQIHPNDFFDIKLNTRYGLSHLRWCLDTAGTEVAALAMYNVGKARVTSHGTPKQTLDYVSRILRRQDKIEKLFVTEYSNIITHMAGKHQRGSYRLNLLTPLGGR